MKFRIKDDCGNKYTVEEVEERDADIINEVEDDEQVEVIPEEGQACDLLPEEVDALKRLAAIADKLIALLPTEEADEAEEPEEVMDEDVTEEITEEPTEEVMDEDIEEEKVVKTKDSLESFGSVEKRRIASYDSINDDAQSRIVDDWAQYYSKAKEGR